jgi:hypothetical protein
MAAHAVAHPCDLRDVSSFIDREHNLISEVTNQSPTAITGGGEGRPSAHAADRMAVSVGSAQAPAFYTYLACVPLLGEVDVAVQTWDDNPRSARSAHGPGQGV